MLALLIPVAVGGVAYYLYTRKNSTDTVAHPQAQMDVPLSMSAALAPTPDVQDAFAEMHDQITSDAGTSADNGGGGGSGGGSNTPGFTTNGDATQAVLNASASPGIPSSVGLPPGASALGGFTVTRVVDPKAASMMHNAVIAHAEQTTVKSGVKPMPKPANSRMMRR